MKLGEAIEEVIKAKGMKWATVDAPHRECECAAIIYNPTNGFATVGVVPIVDGVRMFWKFEASQLFEHSMIVHQLEYQNKKNEPLDYIVLDFEVKPSHGIDYISGTVENYPRRSGLESTISRMRAEGYYGRLRVDWRIAPDVD